MSGTPMPKDFQPPAMLRTWAIQYYYKGDMNHYHLSVDHELFRLSAYGAWQKYTLVQLLSMRFPGKAKVTQRMFKELMALLPPPQEAPPIYHFWQHLQPEALPSLDIHMDPGKGMGSYVFFGPEGVKRVLETARGPVVQSDQNLGQVFFHGPEVWDLPLAFRRRMLALLSVAGGVPLASGFPLIDYDKLEKQEWSTARSDNKGTFATLHPGKLELGGWEGRDGGSHFTSLEQFYLDNSLLTMPQAWKTQINQCIASAIVP